MRFAPHAVPWLVGLIITSAYWFTASTSFANPAVTVARALTASFSGIAPGDAPGFVAAEIVGALAMLWHNGSFCRAARRGQTEGGNPASRYIALYRRWS